MPIKTLSDSCATGRKRLDEDKPARIEQGEDIMDMERVFENRRQSSTGTIGNQDEGEADNQVDKARL